MLPLFNIIQKQKTMIQKLNFHRNNNTSLQIDKKCFCDEIPGVAKHFYFILWLIRLAATLENNQEKQDTIRLTFVDKLLKPNCIGADMTIDIETRMNYYNKILIDQQNSI